MEIIGPKKMNNNTNGFVVISEKRVLRFPVIVCVIITNRKLMPTNAIKLNPKLFPKPKFYQTREKSLKF
jgi:hypothetical protein